MGGCVWEVGLVWADMGGCVWEVAYVRKHVVTRPRYDPALHF
jgi:hypothetical protein